MDHVTSYTCVIIGGRLMWMTLKLKSLTKLIVHSGGVAANSVMFINIS